MPSDLPPSPPPNGPPRGGRRRPAPVVGGNTLILLILLVLAAVWFSQSLNATGSLEWGEFYAIVKDPGQNRALKRVALVGSDRYIVEVDEAKAKELLPEAIRNKIRNNRFTVARLQVLEIKDDVNDRLRELALPYKTDKDGNPIKDKDGSLAKKDGEPLHYYQQEEYFGPWMQTFLYVLLPGLLLVLFFIFFVLPRFRDPLGGGFLSNYIKSPAKRYERNKGRITFDDVAGMQNAKGELQEVVEFLRSPEKFQRLGAIIPKGVLLVGPPGTGKTLLARAVAGEAGVPFYSISGSEFIQMFVGVGASRVRDMFKTAKENSPCILFIDEIDAVGRMRGAGVGGGSDEREQTLNQILSEMDGFTPNEAVIVMAATNRPDVLDSALLRPGRFDRHITIDRPTWQGRMAILKVHTRNKPLADEVNLESIARAMIGMTGADLRNLANEAALIATREGKSKIDRHDFEAAADRVMMGPRREEILTPEGKRKTAYHEIGHALVGFLEPKADPPHKVTIIPRGQALGVTVTPPDEDRHHHGLDYWRAWLAVVMGGRAADRLIYGQPFSGHEDDLKRATRLARYMVTHWGMSERLGPMSFRIGEEHVFLGKEIQEPRDFSEGTAAVIDEEVQRMLREADDRAFELLKANRDKMDRLVEALLQREELVKEEMEQILREETNGVVAGPPSGGFAAKHE